MTWVPSRRGVVLGLVGTLGGLAALGTSSVIVCNRRTAFAPNEVIRRLAVTLPEVFAPDRLAAHWMPRGDTNALTAEVMARPQLVAALEVTCEASRRARVRAQVSEDFVRGDIHVVDRLVVSYTECVIAALCMPSAERLRGPTSDMAQGVGVFDVNGV